MADSEFARTNSCCRKSVATKYFVPDGLPSELTQKIPQLADYGYAKMKDQILIVNELDGKIAEIIPETQPQTTGQK